jgi:putative ABC transport system permease protein
MISNYFKLAIKVLARRKFFTFISLFGISFTLMILMLAAAFLETELGDNPPLSNKDKMVFVPMVTLKLERQDTLTHIDTLSQNGQTVYDTTYEYVTNTPSVSNSSLSFRAFDENLRNLPSAENYSFFTYGFSFDVFVNGKKLNLDVTHTDAAFWEIFDFRFEEGGPFRQQQIENQEQVAVITKETALNYFGKESGLVGEQIEIDKKKYTVSGLLADLPTSKMFVQAGVYLPYTCLEDRTLKDKGYMGSFVGAFMAGRPSDRDQLKSEIEHAAGLVELPDPEKYNVLEFDALTFAEHYAREIYWHEDPKKSLQTMTFILAGLLSLFFLLPTLNLINVNISRIMERSDEIGLRKAFGASSGNILFQFVFENIILTLIGGVLGLALAFILLKIFNDSRILGEVSLNFNYKVFLYSLLICIFFGILSGIIPAYRMSRIHIVNALKQNQL